MRRGFFSPSVRPGVYYLLAGLLGLMALWIHLGFIPHHRYSPGYFRAMAAFAVPAIVFLCLAELGSRKHR